MTTSALDGAGWKTEEGKCMIIQDAGVREKQGDLAAAMSCIRG